MRKIARLSSLADIPKNTFPPMSDHITSPTEEQISTRARAIWEAEGQPEGKAEEHWRQAEDEVRHSMSKASLPAGEEVDES